MLNPMTFRFDLYARGPKLGDEAGQLYPDFVGTLKSGLLTHTVNAYAGVYPQTRTHFLTLNVVDKRGEKLYVGRLHRGMNSAGSVHYWAYLQGLLAVSNDGRSFAGGDVELEIYAVRRLDDQNRLCVSGNAFPMDLGPACGGRDQNGMFYVF